MGAQVYDGGTMFRVWAPNAQKVFVAGDFNNWDPKATPLISEGNGNFSADVPGAAAGQEYQYVIEHNGQTLWRQDPRALASKNSNGNSIIYDQQSFKWSDQGFKMPPRNEMVMAEIHVGTFNDDPGGGPGTFKSAIDKLDKLAELGINTIELMPVAEFAGDFSWGYNPALPFSPERAYGSPDDLKRLVDEAHKRGIAVVLDVVYNHIGPSDNALWDFDGESYGKGGNYFYTDGRVSTPWGDSRPDYGRQQVQDYLYDNAMMWLKDYHFDGLRLDAVNEIRSANGQDNPDGWKLLKRINETVKRDMPGKLMIAEDGQDWDAITGDQGAEFGSQWDKTFEHKLRDVAIQRDDGSRDLSGLAEQQKKKFNGEQTHRIISDEDHDEIANGKQRLPSEIDPGDPSSRYARLRSMEAAAVLLTSPGIPMLSQGQWLLQKGWFQDTDPIDWSKEDATKGVGTFYKDMIHLRRNWTNQTAGLRGNNINTYHVDNNNKVEAIHRWENGGPGDDTVVIFNWSNQTLHDYDVGFPSEGKWKVRLNSQAQTYSPDFDNTPTFDVDAGAGGGPDNMPANGKLTLGPYSVVVLSRDR
jgi:1,4-alpha-glucan branching enzyme